MVVDVGLLSVTPVRIVVVVGVESVTPESIDVVPVESVTPDNIDVVPVLKVTPLRIDEVVVGVERVTPLMMLVSPWPWVMVAHDCTVRVIMSVRRDVETGYAVS